MKYKTQQTQKGDLVLSEVTLVCENIQAAPVDREISPQKSKAAV